MDRNRLTLAVMVVGLLVVTGCQDRSPEEILECRSEHDRCKRACDEALAEAESAYGTGFVECSSSMIAAFDRCDEAHTPHTNPWSDCIRGAIADFRECRAAIDAQLNAARQHAADCRHACLIEYIDCLTR